MLVIQRISVNQETFDFILILIDKRFQSGLSAETYQKFVNAQWCSWPSMALCRAQD